MTKGGIINDICSNQFNFPQLKEVQTSEDYDVDSDIKDICGVMESESPLILSAQLADFYRCKVLNSKSPEEVLGKIDDKFQEVRLSLHDVISKAVETCLVHQQVDRIYNVFRVLADRSESPIYCFFCAFIALNLNDPKSCIFFCHKSSSQNADFHGSRDRLTLNLGYIKAR